MNNIDAAVQAVADKFPIEGYVSGNLAPWITVGNAIQKYLPKGSRVFDFGSGGCDKTAVAQTLGCQCTAYDDLQDDWYKRDCIQEKIGQFASDIGIEFHREFPEMPPCHYDMVMMNDVLEHIHDSPRTLLNTLVSGLKEDGYLFITVPNLANIRKRVDLMRGKTNMAAYDLYYWYNGVWRGPQREYVRSDLQKLCTNLGVEIVELGTVHHMLENLPAYLHPAYKLVTRIFPDWRDTWLLVAKKPVGWAPVDSLDREKFADIYGEKGYSVLYK